MLMLYAGGTAGITIESYWLMVFLALNCSYSSVTENKFYIHFVILCRGGVLYSNCCMLIFAQICCVFVKNEYIS